MSALRELVAAPGLVPCQALEAFFRDPPAERCGEERESHSAAETLGILRFWLLKHEAELEREDGACAGRGRACGEADAPDPDRAEWRKGGDERSCAGDPAEPPQDGSAGPRGRDESDSPRE